VFYLILDAERLLMKCQGAPRSCPYGQHERAGFGKLIKIQIVLTCPNVHCVRCHYVFRSIFCATRGCSMFGEVLRLTLQTESVKSTHSRKRSTVLLLAMQSWRLSYYLGIRVSQSAEHYIDFIMRSFRASQILYLPLHDRYFLTPLCQTCSRLFIHG
jgi:hypothetical protein